MPNPIGPQRQTQPADSTRVEQQTPPKRSENQDELSQELSGKKPGFEECIDAQYNNGQLYSPETTLAYRLYKWIKELF